MQRQGTEGEPAYVRLGLMGIRTKAMAYGFVFLSLALAAGGIVVGLQKPIFFLGAGFLFSAVWYWAAIRWNDRHGVWPRP
jgi:hypothetical protein